MKKISHIQLKNPYLMIILFLTFFIFTFIGVVIAVGYVLIANMLDNTIKTREEVERLYKVPVIAEIPLNLPEKGGKK